MLVLVFCDRTESRRWFERVARARGHSVEHHPVAALKSELRRASVRAGGALAYIDAAAAPRFAPAALVRRAAAVEGVLAAVLDPGRAVGDVAALFRAGAVDYLGPELLEAGVDPARLRAIEAWAGDRDGDAASGPFVPAGRAPGAAPAPEPAAPGGPPGAARAAGQPVTGGTASSAELSGCDWKGVRSGREYLFALMFIEMDNQEALARDHGSESLAKFEQIFHDTVAGVAAPAQGRPWMWSEFGGVLLFPFDGLRCDAIVTGFRLMLNRKLLAIEMYDFDLLPSFRIALHIGATTYHARGQTSRIVSDSVNTIFHLGQKFTRPGNFCMTETLLPFVPAGIRDYFVPAGGFEGHDIWRMRQPF